MPTPVLLAWSGGKDSSLALARVQRDPAYRVCALVTAVTTDYDRISIHGVRRALLESQADATGLPLIEIALRPACTNAEYETAFLDALRRAEARFPRCRTIAFGDLFLEDVRAYREKLLAPTGWTPSFPIWGADTARLARKFVNDGFEARLVCVDTTQLAGTFAGRAFDASLLGDLPRATDPCGERGEFHTFVWRGPVFARDIPVTVGDVVLRDDRFMYCDLLPG